MNLNKVFLAGRLTADPQLRTTQNGRQVASFSIATNRVWTTQDGRRQEAVEYHNIIVWDRQADVVSRFLAKGGLVLVEGRLQTRSWDDKQGQKRKTTEIIGERIQLGPRTFAAAGKPIEPVASPVAENNPVDLPVVEIPSVSIDEPSPVEEIKAEDLPF